jgi:hypothetical protein
MSGLSRPEYTNNSMHVDTIHDDTVLENPGVDLPTQEILGKTMPNDPDVLISSIEETKTSPYVSSGKLFNFTQEKFNWSVTIALIILILILIFRN